MTEFYLLLCTFRVIYGQWEINEDEALIIRFIYEAYLSGRSSPEIADLLTKAGTPTATGLETWSVGAVLGILHNEKYVGDALTKVIVSKGMVTFVFYNGVKISREYTNGQPGNKPGWNKKEEA